VSTRVPPPSTPHQAEAAPTQLRVTTYDRVASLLVSLLILLGAAVVAMLIVVLTMRAVRTQQVAPIVAIEEGSGRGDHEAGSARDEKNTQVDELDEFFPPQIDAAVQAVSDVVAADITVLDSLDDQLITAGSGQGQGDSRRAGPEGEGNEDIVPRWERWQIRFASADVNVYSQQLDFFGIELAAMGGGKKTVDYATRVAQAKPATRAGASEQEKRLYMTWRSGEMIEADKQLLAKAGIDTSGRVVLQFYPPAIEAILAALEQKQLGNRSLKEVKRTSFGVRGVKDNYEFYVISQEYRFTP
jgi:hypothetical protein